MTGPLLPTRTVSGVWCNYLNTKTDPELKAVIALAAHSGKHTNNYNLYLEFLF